MEKTLWDYPPPARAGQVTQQIAAESVAHNSAAMREQVCQYLRGISNGTRNPEIKRHGFHGATNEEIALDLDMRLQTVCGRVNELQAQGRVKWGGAVRSTRSGRPAKVWVINEEGQSNG